MEAANRVQKPVDTQAEIERLFPLENEPVKAAAQIDLHDLSHESLPTPEASTEPKAQTINLPRTPGEQTRLIESLQENAEKAHTVAAILESNVNNVGRSALRRLFEESRSDSGALLTNLRLFLLGSNTLSMITKFAADRPGSACVSGVIALMWGSLTVLHSPGTRKAIVDWFKTPGAKHEANQVLKKVGAELNRGDISKEEAKTLVKNIAEQYRNKADHLTKECEKLEELIANWRSTRSDSLEKEIVDQFNLSERLKLQKLSSNLWDQLYADPNGAIRARKMQEYIKTALRLEREPEIIGIEDKDCFPLNSELLAIKSISNSLDRIKSYQELRDHLGQYSEILAKRLPH